MKNFVIAQDEAGDWLLFANPVRFLCTYDLKAVKGMLDEASQAVSDGYCVAGFVSYESATGIDPVMVVHPASNRVPLVWFGLYSSVQRLSALPPSSWPSTCHLGDWDCDTDAQEYRTAIQRIKAYIREGDTYQVNYTVRLKAPFEGAPYALFCRLVQAQQSRNAVYIETDALAICSASPELFFSRSGPFIQSRPMKGTAARALTAAADRQAIATLAASEKNRAENVMIADMIRNDIGRIAIPGTVSADRLFDIESYPTLHQMVSTVQAQTDADLSDTFGALFPCASITGAPKVRTMQIIRELERSPRGLYTGTCGYWMPGDIARFNVAIRTVVVDRRKGMAEYGTGGGIVWDSTHESEYAECFTKARIVTRPPMPPFRLLESLRYDSENGWFLLDAHINRASASAAYFQYPFDMLAMRQVLDDCVTAAEGGSPLKVRWLLSADGHMQAEASALSPADQHPWRVGIAENACRSDELFCYHKTTVRDVYDAALKRFPDCRDVILINDAGAVTESCFGNIVIESGGRRGTPPVSCGLLAGTFRDHLLARGEINEQMMTLEDLYNADHIWIINSVRTWIPVKLHVNPRGTGENGT